MVRKLLSAPRAGLRPARPPRGSRKLGAARRFLESDAQWKRIEQMLPGKPGDVGRSGADNRLFVEAVLWIARTGSPWRDLPGEFGNWNSAYVRFARWSRAGVWQAVFAALAKDADFREAMIDSTIVRAHQHAAGAQKKPVRKRSAARAGD
jgi:transposase